MLKNIDSIIDPELLHTLAEMGHGDEIAVVDRHFPARSKNGRVHYLRSLGCGQVIKSVLTLFPLDGFTARPVISMAVPAEEWAQSSVQGEVLDICRKASSRPLEYHAMERDEFYRRTETCFAVVATGESRPYGCFILTKGVLPEFGPYIRS